MLNQVAIPLAEMYPEDAWELLLGYDMQRAISARAGNAVAAAARMAEEQSLESPQTQYQNAR